MKSRPQTPLVLGASSIAIATLGVLTACIGTNRYDPGTPLGTFSVSAAVTSNSCQESPNPWVFAVQLSEEPGELFWIQNDVPIEGALDSSGNFTMSSTSTDVVVAADDAGRGGCTMQRVDTLEGVTSGSPVTGLTGTLSYAFTVSSGDCSSQLASQGGTYHALPCTIAFDLTATRTAAPATTSTADSVHGLASSTESIGN